MTVYQKDSQFHPNLEGNTNSIDIIVNFEDNLNSRINGLSSIRSNTKIQMTSPAHAKMEHRHMTDMKERARYFSPGEINEELK